MLDTGKQNKQPRSKALTLLIGLGLLLGIAGFGYLEWKGRTDPPVEQVVAHGMRLASISLALTSPM